MPTTDFSAPADFYSPVASDAAYRSYRRFDSLADAIRHAVEDAPRSQLMGTLIECDERRYDAEAIGVLCQSNDYPLVRATVAT